MENTEINNKKKIIKKNDKTQEISHECSVKSDIPIQPVLHSHAAGIHQVILGIRQAFP